jgi:hypothetical protein
MSLLQFLPGSTSMSPRCVFAALIAAISLAIPASAALADEAAELKEKILAAWKLREEKVRSFKVHWNSEVEQSARLRRFRLKAPDDHTIEGKIEKRRGLSLAGDGNKYAQTFYHLDVDLPSRFVTDGQVATDYYNSTLNDIITGLVWNHARFTVYRGESLPLILCYRPWSYLVMGESPTELTANPIKSTVDDRECIVADVRIGPFIDRLTLDLQSDFIVRRITVLVQPSATEEAELGGPLQPTVIDEFRIHYRQAASPLSEIRSWELDHYDLTYPGTLAYSYRAKVTKAEINTELPKEEFDPYDFPVGTRVYSMDEEGESKGLWIQGPKGERLPWKELPLPKLQDEIAKELGKGNSYSLVLLCVSVLIFVTALTLWWRCKT